VLDLQVNRVDHPLALGEHPGRLAADVFQGLRRPGQVLDDHGEQLEHLRLDRLQRPVELSPGAGHAQRLQPAGKT
jgi:hypothetical protein